LRGQSGVSETPSCRRKLVFRCIWQASRQLAQPRLWKNRFPLTRPSAQV
jgi:hypothetical protein